MFVRALPVLVVLLLVSVAVPGAEIRHEGEGKIEDNRYFSIDGSYSVEVPELDSEVVTVTEHDDGQGISAMVSFGGDLERRAWIISTKIREEFPKDDRSMVRQVTHLKAEYIGRGGYLESMEFIGDQEGKILQTVVRYVGAGLPVQVRDEFLDKLVDERMDVIGIHRYIVRNGYYIEVTHLCPLMAPDEVIREDRQVGQAVKTLTDMMATLEFDAAADPYITQLLADYEVRETYLSQIVPDVVKALEAADEGSTE